MGAEVAPCTKASQHEGADVKKFEGEASDNSIISLYSLSMFCRSTRHVQLLKKTDYGMLAADSLFAAASKISLQHGLENLAGRANRQFAGQNDFRRSLVSGEIFFGSRLKFGDH